MPPPLCCLSFTLYLSLSVSLLCYRLLTLSASLLSAPCFSPLPLSHHLSGWHCSVSPSALFVSSSLLQLLDFIYLGGVAPCFSPLLLLQFLCHCLSISASLPGWLYFCPLHAVSGWHCFCQLLVSLQFVFSFIRFSAAAS